MAFRGVLPIVLVLLLLGAAVPMPITAGESPQVVLGPYVQDLSSDGVTLVWETDGPGISFVQFGLDPRGMALYEDGGDGTHHERRIEGLAEDTTYYYALGSGNGSLGPFHFTTPARGPGPFSFAVYGDCRSGHEAHAGVMELMLERDPAIIINTGDLVADGASEDDWETFMGIAGPGMGNVSYWPTLGNHEWPGEIYHRLFALPGNELWYSFDWRGAHFVCLDSTGNLSVGSEQFLWLEEDLVSSDARWIFVYFHYPPYSSSKHGSCLDLRADLDPLFGGHNVTAVFNGHDHSYEHVLPPSGVHYFVTGGGGGPLYEVGESEWTVRSRTVHHFLMVRVGDEGVLLEAVDIDGRVFERTVIGEYDLGDEGPVDDDGGIDLLPLLLVLVLVAALAAVVVLARARRASSDVGEPTSSDRP